MIVWTMIVLAALLLVGALVTVKRAVDGDGDGDRLGRTTGAAKAVGAKLALLWIVPGHFLKVSLRQSIVATTRVMPFVGKSFWRGMVKWSIWQYQRAASADVVNLSAEPQGLEPRVANWQESDADDPQQKPGWNEVGGDKTWGPGADGRAGVERMGKADVIISDRAAHETAEPLQLRFDEALDLERVEPLVAPATVHQTLVETWPGDPAEMDADAVKEAAADGGQLQRRQHPIEVDPNDAVPDAVVDLASDFGDGKGMQVSARKYRDEKLSTADAEKLDKAETRGKLAGMKGASGDKIFKMALICIAAIVLIIFAIFGLPILFGSGGGGGAVPI